MGVCSLGYVALNVSDMASWRDLATSVLGMEVIERSYGDIVDLRIDDLHHRFSLYPAKEDSIEAVGWEVATLSDLHDLVEKLTAYGVEVHESPPCEKSERKVHTLFKFIDPASGIKSELFYAPQSEMMPFTPSLGMTGYKTGNMGLGHVVYIVGDYEESKKFYEEVMGFRLSDYIAWDDKDATFYHCNGRHHSLAIMKPFGDFKAGDFNHIMLETNSIDDVGYAYDVVRDKGIPLVMEYGKHTNDLMQSFYIVTPSGFALELGYGGRLIENDWEIRSYDSPMLWGHRSPEGNEPTT